jgi:RNA polymerase sigma-70 factor (ECF subfamily)
MLHHVRIDHAKREAWIRDQVPLEEVNTPGIPASQLARLECRELGQAIQALPDGQREVLLLVCLEGLSYQETAELMDIPIGTVMSRLNRARTALKQLLTPEPAAEPRRISATGGVRSAA